MSSCRAMPSAAASLGRTGRAGRKGIAMLIVPGMRRRRVEAMLRTARIPVEWTAVPTADESAPATARA
jgi:ATP-dependent RNA helicase DeaD